MYYSIPEIILILIVCFNSDSIVNFLTKNVVFFNRNFYDDMNELIKFYEFMCENNPILLSYYDDEDAKQEDFKVEIMGEIKQVQIKYEDKYLAKFKAFPNEFRIDETELKHENEEYERIKQKYEKTRLDTINSIQESLLKINEIQENCIIDHTKEKYTENINAFGMNCLKIYFGEGGESDEDQDYIEELYQDLLKEKKSLLKRLNETEKMIMTEEEMRKKSREVIIKIKLDKFMDNYILEHTPLGNIFMRYNNDKKSFEYFSNHTIPYRYLEAVGRKYVTTYWCKPLFVDIEEELKKAEIKFDEGMKVKETYKKIRKEEIKNNQKDVVARMKSYNKDRKSNIVTNQPTKNRSENNVLPPQIRANLSNVNQSLNKQLLKEQSNRYTWEGRLSGFCPLKKIDKKMLDNKLNMSYAEFKKMEKNITK